MIAGFSLRIDDVNPKQFCENSNVGDIIGNVTASGGVKPYTFTILTPEFATFVTLVDNGNYADLKLKRQFDREVRVNITKQLFKLFLYCSKSNAVVFLSILPFKLF